MPVHLKRDAHRLCAVVTIDEPRTRNALTADTFAGLREAVAEAAADASLASVVVTGAGGFFSSGGDVKGLKQRTEMPASERRAGIDRLHELIQSIVDCPHPVIAAVDGGAAGAGVSLALACDLIVAAEDAAFSLAYVKIGLTPDGGATAFLSEALPRHLVTELCLFGDPVSAARLHNFGVVNRLAASGEALEQALRVAARVAAGAASAQARIKRLARAGRANPLGAQLELEAEFMAASFGTPEGREGVTAFLGKRAPDFRKLRS